MAITTEIQVKEDLFDLPQHALVNSIEAMFEKSKALTVDSDESYKKVTSLYSQAREWKKAIEAKRKELVEPFRKQTAAINDKAKELTDPLDRVIDMANSKSAAYMRMLEESKRKEDEKIKSAAALFDAEEEIYIPELSGTLRGDGAMLTTKIEKNFKLVDIAKVPKKYLLVDEAAVKRDLKLGVFEIPGLEIYETTKTQLRTR